MQLIRQMQQKCVPIHLFCFQNGGGGNVECSAASFMEELQRYESLYSKFSKDHKNKQVRDNCWLALGKKFNMTAEEAEKKYKSIRSSYGRWLRKVKKVPSGSGRRIYLKKSSLSSCFNSCTRVLYSPSCSLLWCIAWTQNLCFLRFRLSLLLHRTAVRRK